MAKQDLMNWFGNICIGMFISILGVPIAVGLLLGFLKSVFIDSSNDCVRENMRTLIEHSPECAAYTGILCIVVTAVCAIIHLFLFEGKE